MRKPTAWRLASMLVATVVLVGCATPPTPIPAMYYQPNQTMSVKVTQCPREAQMMDSGQGGLIGALITAGVRGSSMRKQMEGIKGQTVQELVRQKVAERVETYFEINDQSSRLAAEIAIQQWGWFVPTTALGIKTGSYQFRINGTVVVRDLEQPKKKMVGYVMAASEQPLGNNPSADVSQEALLKAVDEFSDRVVAVILKNRPSSP